MATQRMAVVISGDVIGSTKLKPPMRKKMQQLLDSTIRQSGKQWPDFEVQQYRGDSLQAVFTKNRKAALQFALLLQSNLARQNIHIRLAIGTGQISFKGKNIITSDGPAFQASGPYLDILVKTGGVISIAGSSETFTNEWQVHSASLNFILQRLTTQQAEAIYLQLQGYTQQEIAKKLKIKQPSVHQRLQGAGWPVLQKIIQRFESVIEEV